MSPEANDGCGIDMNNRDDRLKAALRENLKRRKDQIRGQKERKKEPSAGELTDHGSSEREKHDGEDNTGNCSRSG